MRRFYLNVLLIFIVIKLINCELQMTILHTNDMHARLKETSKSTGPCKSPEPCYGGFARVAYEVRQLKLEKPNTLHLNAGDSYQGTPFYSVLKYKVLLEVMDKMGIDVMSLGNHEFDDGVAGLAPYLQQIRIPTVSCNIDTSKEPSLTNHTVLKPWHMVQVENVKIAIIGYLTPDTRYVSSPGKVVILDEIEMIKKYAKEAKDVGAQLIFALGHSGFLKDKEIAKAVADVDVVVGGHTDTFLYTGTPPDIDVPVDVYPVMIEQESGKKVPVVQAFRHTKYLGKLNLVWNDEFSLVSATGNPILLDSKVLKDEEIESIVMKWDAVLSVQLQQKKGSTSVKLNGQCRWKECNLGNSITDSYADYARKHTEHSDEWKYEPIVLLPGGGIRSTIEPTDNITMGDLLTILPFDNQLLRLTMKGSTLLKALHRSIERYDKSVGYGEFLQLHGLKVAYEEGDDGKIKFKRAFAKCVKCSPEPTYEEIDPNKEYVVLTILFVQQGGDGYSMIKDEAILEQIYEDNDLNIYAKYLQNTSPIHPNEEGRITFLGPAPLSSSNLQKYNFYLLIISLYLVFIK